MGRRKKPNGCSPTVNTSNSGVHLTFKCEAKDKPRSMDCCHFEKSSVLGKKCHHINTDGIFSGPVSTCTNRVAQKEALKRLGYRTKGDLIRGIIMLLEPKVVEAADRVGYYNERGDMIIDGKGK